MAYNLKGEMMNDSTNNTINELLDLEPYERKQIAMVLIASTLGEMSRKDACRFAKNLYGFPTESN